MHHDEFIPAFRYAWLTPLYDPIQRWVFRESVLRSHLLEKAHIESGQRVLDLGCGTATLTILIKKLHPETEVWGLDADPEVLLIARSKALRAGAEITFDCGLASRLPYPDGSFDRVASSLMFHHLRRDQKRAAMREVFRVLRPGGEFLLADLGKPHNALMYLISLVARRMERAADNIKGLLPGMLEEAGFNPVQEAARFAMPYGTACLHTARKPESALALSPGAGRGELQSAVLPRVFAEHPPELCGR